MCGVQNSYILSSGVMYNESMSEKLEKPAFYRRPKGETDIDPEKVEQSLDVLRNEMQETVADMQYPSYEITRVKLFWEAVKKNERFKKHEQEKGQPAKQVLCFLGLPGTGKSTQIKEVKSMLGSERFHLGDYAKEKKEKKGEGNPDDEGRRAKGELLQDLDEEFLEVVSESPNENIILDGFPRSPEQAGKLYDFACVFNWDLQFIHLSFPEDPVGQSYERQDTRNEGNPEEYLGKIDRSIKQDIAAVETARAVDGETVHDIDATQSPEEVTKSIQNKLHFA